MSYLLGCFCAPPKKIDKWIKRMKHFRYKIMTQDYHYYEKTGCMTTSCIQYMEFTIASREKKVYSSFFAVCFKCPL